MAQKVIAAFLLCLCGSDVNGASLSVSTTSACTGGSATIPTGSGVTVVMRCTTTTSTISAIASSIPSASHADNVPAAILNIKRAGTAVFTLTGVASGDGTAIAAVTPATYPNIASQIDGSDANTLVVTITDAPADLSSAGAWTCDVTAGGDAGDDGGAVDVAAETSAGASVDLTTFCTAFTLSRATCDSNTPKLTCDTTIQLDQWEADATAVLSFKLSGTVKYSLAASAISTGATSGNLDSSTGSWTAASAAATVVTIAPTTIATADITTGWTCDITGATGAFRGSSAAFELTACPAYTMSATCTGTTVTALSLSTPGLTFNTFDTAAAYTITVSKGTEERYKLTSSTISSSALSGDLDAAGATLLAGTYMVASTSATTWTFDPTVDITEADEGSDWNMVVVAATATNGGSGDVSITCGAEINKMAGGLLVALLVVAKMFFF